MWDADGNEIEDEDSLIKVRYQPNLSDCEGFVLDCLEKMRTTTNEFGQLEKDLVTFLNLPQKSSFELPSDFKWLVEARE